MAKQISEFTNKATPDGTDEIVIQETGGGTTKKATILAALGAAIDAAFGALTATTIDGVIGSVTPAAGTFTDLNVDASGGVTVGSSSDAYSGIIIQSSSTGESELRMGDTDTDAGSVAYDNNTDTMTFRAAAANRVSFTATLNTLNEDTVIGGTSAGATSAVTAYADGSLKASTGSSGASIPAAADDFVLEGSAAQVGMTIGLAASATGYYNFAGVGDATVAGMTWNESSDTLTILTDKAGATTVFLSDDEVTNLTLSGASGSELLAAAGSVSVTDFLRTPYKSELTIASGVVTATGSHHFVDTESDAATDDLDTINGGTSGDRVVFRCANNSRDVVFKDATGNLRIAGDFTLTNSQDTIELMFDGSNWIQLSRSNNT